MNKLIFPLKRSLVLPATERPNKGLLVFLPEQFGLTYKIVPNASEKSMLVQLFIIDLSDNWTYLIKTFNITENGFPTGKVLNADVISTYNLTYDQLLQSITNSETQLVILEAERATLISLSQDVPNKLNKDIEDLQNLRIQSYTELKNLGEKPLPILEYYNKYSDVIDFFEKSGEISLDGVSWAKNIPFFGLTLGDFI